MNRRQIPVVMAMSDELVRINRDADGMYRPPTPEQWRVLMEASERLEWPWVRLWHRIKPPAWRTLYPPERTHPARTEGK